MAWGRRGGSTDTTNVGCIHEWIGFGAVPGLGADGPDDAVEAVGGEEGDVGNIADAVVRDAGAYLIGGFGPAGDAGARIGGWVEGVLRAGAGAAAAAFDEAGIASGRRVGGAVQAELRAVPGLLGEGLLQGAEVGVVGVGPEAGDAGAARGIVGEVDIGSADADIPGSGGESVDAKSVAAEGACVSGGDEDGLPLGGGLLPKTGQFVVFGLSEFEFAEAEAEAEDGGSVVVDGALNRVQETAVAHQAEAAGDVELDGGVGRDGAGVFDVEIRLDGIAVDAGVVAVHDHLGRIGGKVEELAVGVDEAEVDVGVVDDADGLAGSVQSSGVGGSDVVLLGDILGSEKVEGSSGGVVTRRVGPVRGGLALVRLGIVEGLTGQLGLGDRLEVVELGDAGDEGAEGRGDLRRGRVGVVGFALHRVGVDRGMEGGLDLADRSGELDGALSGGDLGDGEAVGLKPAGELLDVRVGGAKLLGEGSRRQPLMEVGRTGLVGLLEKLLEGGLLLGRALEDQLQAAGGLGGIGLAEILRAFELGRDGTFERDTIRVIDPRGDERLGLRQGGGRGRSKQQERQHEQDSCAKREAAIHRRVSPGGWLMVELS